ncbi:MAG TPA: ATP-binding cassette domain-containing protein, partial [Nitrospiraceae bacterium]|nr:ATP-binding cassette domain-containing protein [Nitrospiraceae bacterium]
MTIVDIQHAEVYRGDQQVFADLTLQIDAGVDTAILGPNAAGKSTLLKLLSLDIHPVLRNNGFLRLFGRDTWNVWELRRHLGVVS